MKYFVIAILLNCFIQLSSSFSQTKEIFVSSEPESSAVFLSGVHKGETPLRLEINTHAKNTLVLRKHGYIEFAETLSVSIDSVESLRVTMLKPARIKVVSIPDSSSVFIDGVLRGTTPLFLDSVAPGFHNVVVSRWQYTAFRKSLVFESGQFVELGPTLTLVMSTLRIFSQDEYVKFFLDGELIGIGPADSLNVKIGKHNLEMKNELQGILTSKEFVAIPYGRNIFETRLRFRSTQRILIGAALPGYNQVEDGDYWKGVMLAGSAVFGLTNLIYTHIHYNDRFDDFLAARDAYRHATTDYSSEALGQEMQARHSELKTADTQYAIAKGLVLSVWLLNLLDVYIFHSIDDEIIRIGSTEFPRNVPVTYTENFLLQLRIPIN